MPSSILASGMVERPAKPGAGAMFVLRTLWHDKFAALAALVLLVVMVLVIFGPMMLAEEARTLNLRARNAPPLSFEHGWLFVLGGDALGRSLLARMIVASQNTIVIAATAVGVSALLGGFLGLVAGYRDGVVGAVLLRLADAIMSFPTMLLAVLILFIFEPGVLNVILILAISRIPIFMRTVRAEVLELKQRMFVVSARAMGARDGRILLRHVAPMVLPTLINLAALEMAFVMLIESSLSFLGIGIQPPEVTWGLMVSDGRNYLQSAWWLAFWPGLAITAVAMSLNILSNWLRVVTDPVERWRLETEAR